MIYLIHFEFVTDSIAKQILNLQSPLLGNFKELNLIEQVWTVLGFFTVKLRKISSKVGLISLFKRRTLQVYNTRLLGRFAPYF